MNGLSLISELNYSSFSKVLAVEKKEGRSQVAGLHPESTVLTCHLERHVPSSLWPKFPVSKRNEWVE